MLLHPLKDPMPPPLAARGRALLGLLDEVSHAEALELACRTLVGVLLTARRSFEESQADQVSYNTLCQQVEQWVKRELKPLRFRDAKGAWRDTLCVERLWKSVKYELCRPPPLAAIWQLARCSPQGYCRRSGFPLDSRRTRAACSAAFLPAIGGHA